MLIGHFQYMNKVFQALIARYSIFFLKLPTTKKICRASFNIWASHVAQSDVIGLLPQLASNYNFLFSRYKIFQKLEYGFVLLIFCHGHVEEIWVLA